MRPILNRLRRHAPRGLSLLETLVVIAVAAIVIGMVLTTFWYAIKTVRSFK
jgi:prepilin-type N-terminal cleavage/methylation domain-containing protein